MPAPTRLHPFAITGVGSLPHRDPDDAIALVESACPIVPFWPQLPNRSPREGMIDQCLGGLGDLFVEPAAGRTRVRAEHRSELIDRLGAPHRLAEDEAVGLARLTARLEDGGFPSAAIVKGQVAGPITIASCLDVGGRPAVEDDELLVAIANRVRALVRGQAERLAIAGHAVLVVLDEPILGVPDAPIPDGAIDRLAECMDRDGAPMRGLHCCSRMPLALLDRLDPDLYSFDADAGLESFYADPAARRFLARGRLVALGAVPTTEDPHVDVAAVARRFVESAGDAFDPAELAARTFVTANCGLAARSIAAAERSFAAARRLSIALSDATRKRI